MFCRPRILAPIVHPPICCEQHHFMNYIVPHVHPSHITHVNHQMFQHQHYYPQTESVVSDVSHQHFHCGPGPFMG
jgi:spore coat protein D